MADRPTWRGHLRFSLVSCPVSLLTALNPAAEAHFHLINPKPNNRIKMVATDPDSGPVDRAKLVKGYEVAKDEYILLTPDDLDAVKLESTKTIDIERFVAADEIDRLYWDHPYFVTPDGKIAQEAFAVIRMAMEKAGQIALGRVVIGSRERILALEPRDKGILATTIRSSAEVRDPDTLFKSIADKIDDPSMVSIATKIIEQKEGPFNPDTFVDRYEAALKELIEDKKNGRKPAKAPEHKASNVVDLATALRESLKSKGATKAQAAKTQAAKTQAAKPRAKRARKAG